MRHPTNHGERLWLNRTLQSLGRDHRGRASRDQKSGVIRRINQRKLDNVIDELDYEPDLEQPIIIEFFGGQTPPFIDEVRYVH